MSEKQSDPAESKEFRILRAMKTTLTRIIKDTATQPGLKHPLSDRTIEDIRQCLGLISARERELAEEAGKPMGMRPHYADEPQKLVVVPIEARRDKFRQSTVIIGHSLHCSYLNIFSSAATSLPLK